MGRLIVAFNKKGEVIKIDEKSGLLRVAGGSNPDAVTPDSFIRANVVDPVQDFVDGLAGLITAAQYPEGGEGSITTVP